MPGQTRKSAAGSTAALPTKKDKSTKTTIPTRHESNQYLIPNCDSDFIQAGCLHVVGSITSLVGLLAEKTIEGAPLLVTFEKWGVETLTTGRHIQPHCVNLILTGYPALETALQAIYSQVDDYLTKPTGIRLQLMGPFAKAKKSTL